MKNLSDRMLRIKGSAEHSRGTCVNRRSRSADEQSHKNAPHRNCLRKKNTACVTLFVFFTITRGTSPYSIEDDASTTSQTPTTHYISTWVKLTIVTCPSFSERLAIANLSFSVRSTNSDESILQNTRIKRSREDSKMYLMTFKTKQRAAVGVPGHRARSRVTCTHSEPWRKEKRNLQACPQQP